MFDYNKLEELYTSMGFRAEVVSAIVSLATVLDKQGLSDSQKQTVYRLLSDAGQESLKEVPEKVVTGEWAEFDYGNVKIGDYVRVKPDAYDSETGTKHNGRVGILKYMAHKRCNVEYVGAEGGEAMAHPMDNLESIRLR
jgi:hypothetical protein